MSISSFSKTTSYKGKTLRQILSWNFVIAALLPVILITGIVLYQFINDKTSDIKDKNLLIARAVKGQVEVFLREPVNVLDDIRYMVKKEPSYTVLEIKEILKDHILHSNALESIYILNNKGEVISVCLKPGKEKFEKDYIGINLAHKVFYQKALQSKQSTWSDTFLSLISGKISMAICHVIDDRILVGNFNIDQLSSFINNINIGKGVAITIVDRSGAIVAQSGLKDTLRQIKTNHIELFKKGLAGDEGTQTYTFDNVNYIGSVSAIPGPGWLAAVSQKTADLYEPLILSGIYIIAAAVVIFVLSILFGIINSRKLSAPLMQLNERARKVAEGDYDLEWDQQSYSEVSDLTSSFQHMIENIRDRENRIQESQRLYRMLFEKTNDAIFVIDKNTGRYLDANDAGLKLTSRSLSEIKNLTVRDITPERAQERLNRIYSIDKTQDFGKIVYHHPDGSKRIANLSVLPIDDVSIIGIARDITDELAIEGQLRQAQKMEALGTLAGGVAHDFNNILGIIIGYSELLKSNPSLDPLSEGKIDQIINAGSRASKLVRQILAFSRQDNEELIQIQPHLIINEALKMLRSSIPTTIRIESNIPKLGSILGSPTQLHQIVMNLCTNAYHAMRKTGGVLRVSWEAIALQEKDLKLSGVHLPAGSYLLLEVSDTGHGMDKVTVERIFDPYFTTKKTGEGTGLGLSVVHGIIKKFKGEILVYSEPDKGTIFRVYFPQISTETKLQKLQKEVLDPTGNEHILVVDDEKAIVELEKSMLEGLGYTVTESDNGLEAIRLFEKSSDNIELVITDVTMPDINGVELMKRIRAMKPDLPFILCSGFSELVNEDKIKNLNNVKYLKKPVLKKDFSITIRKLLDNDKKVLGK